MTTEVKTSVLVSEVELKLSSACTRHKNEGIKATLELLTRMY